jgi:hypothetical protein
MIGRVFGSRSRSPSPPRSRSRSPSPRGQRRSISPFSRRKQYGSGNLLPRKRWGKLLKTPGFKYGGFYYNKKSKYNYPLWFYNGNGSYYPWWYAHHFGFMDTLLYNKYLSEYEGPPPNYIYPNALRRGDALPIPMGDEINESISCDVCGSTQEETQLHHCEGCREAIYCGVECQRVDFENHKNNCFE